MNTLKKLLSNIALPLALTSSVVAQPAAREVFPFTTQVSPHQQIAPNVFIDTEVVSPYDNGQDLSVTVAYPAGGVNATTGAILFVNTANTGDSTSNFFGRDGSGPFQNYLNLHNVVGIDVGARGSERSVNDIAEFSVVDEGRGLGRAIRAMSEKGTPLDTTRLYLIGAGQFGGTRALTLLTIAPNLFSEAYIGDAQTTFTGGFGWPQTSSVPSNVQNLYLPELSLRSPAAIVSAFPNAYRSSGSPHITLYHGDSVDSVIPLPNLTNYENALASAVGQTSHLISDDSFFRREGVGNYEFVQAKGQTNAPSPCAYIDAEGQKFTSHLAASPSLLIDTSIPTPYGRSFRFHTAGSNLETLTVNESPGVPPYVPPASVNEWILY